MTAVASKPWWRWFRFRRNRGGYQLGPPVKVLSLVGLLLAFDQVTKHTLTTQDWAVHTQTGRWLLLPTATIAITLPLLLFAITRAIAVLTTSGALGNLVSQLTQNEVANPIQVQYGTTTAAFNLADVYIVSALILAAWAGVILSTRITNPRRQP